MKTLITFFFFIFSFFQTQLVNSALVLNVPKYMQCSSPWGSQQIGFCASNTICQLGCAVTSIAMLLKGNGANVDPGTLNTFLKGQHNGYVNGCEINWPVACSFPNSTMSFVSFHSVTTTKLKSEIDEQDPVIVEVDLPNSNLSHFIVVYGYNNNGNSFSDFLVHDPLLSNSSTLNNYYPLSLRLFNNVIQSTGNISVNFKFNDVDLPPSPNEWKIFKAPEIPSSFYNLKVTITNKPAGVNWNGYIVKTNGETRDFALNVSSNSIQQSFSIHKNESWYNVQNGYRLRIVNRNTGEIWGVSNPFYIAEVPTINLGNIPQNVYIGQNIILTFSISGGITSLPFGGWTNNCQFQLHQNNNALNVIGMIPVSITPQQLNFTIPSSMPNAQIPGTNFRVSMSNPSGSSIPTGYVFKFTNYFNINSVSNVNNVIEIPTENNLYENYPNPFNPITNINFDLKQDGFVTLEVFDISGRLINKLINSNMKAGNHTVSFNGNNLSNGIYFYRLSGTDFNFVKKMILIK